VESGVIKIYERGGKEYDVAGSEDEQMM